MSIGLKYYYDLISQPARSLYIILKLSGTKFESCPVALRKRENLSDKYKLQANRFQKVPCIVDNGFKLAESVAILRYLENKGEVRPDFYPKDTHLRARVDEFLEWQHFGVRHGCRMYTRTKFINPLQTGEPVDEQKLAEWEKVMKDNLKITENIWLEKSKFVAGDSLTVADIFAACEMEQPRMAGYDVARDYPRIAEWWQRVRLETNPYYDEAHRYVYKQAEKSGVRLQFLK